MRKLFISVAALSILTISSFALAQEKPNHFGAQLDVGVPDGVAFGVVAAPVYWLKPVGSFTHNTIAPGFRFGLKVDPIKFPVRLTLTGEIGHSFEGNVSSMVGKQVPPFDYTYVNIQPGLEFGSNNKFSFFIHAGPTWLNASTRSFQSVLGTNDSGVSLSDPRVHGWVVPTFKLGVSWLFI